MPVDMTIDLIKEMRPDRRDEISVEQKIEFFKVCQSVHHEMKDTDASYAMRKELINLVSGPRGGGKTLGAWTWVLFNAYLWGLEVYSVTSLLIGKRMTATEAYIFPDFIEPGSVVLLDEAHAYVERYAEHSNRQRGLSQSLASMRKIQAQFWPISANEPRIGWSLKEDVDWLCYPNKTALPKMRRRSRGRGHYPNWSRILFKCIRRPFGSKYLGQGPPYYALPEVKQSHVKPLKLNPAQVYKAAHLYDSWERVPVLAGIRTKAVDIEETQDTAWAAAAAEIDAAYSARDIDTQLEDLISAFISAFNDGEFEEKFRKGVLPNARTMQVDGLFRTLQRFGCRITNMESFRAVLTELNVPVTQTGAVNLGSVYARIQEWMEDNSERIEDWE